MWYCQKQANITIVKTFWRNLHRSVVKFTVYWNNTGENICCFVCTSVMQIAELGRRKLSRKFSKFPQWPTAVFFGGVGAGGGGMGKGSCADLHSNALYIFRVRVCTPSTPICARPCTDLDCEGLALRRLLCIQSITVSFERCSPNCVLRKWNLCTTV